MSEYYCLRCKTVLLNELSPPPDARISFFECPSCRYHYQLKPGKQLTFRWLHPISLALYGVIFEESPGGRAAELAASIARDRSAEELEWIVREIRQELEAPTQAVRDILDCRASEETLRAFLDSIAGEMEALLASQRRSP